MAEDKDKAQAAETPGEGEAPPKKKLNLKALMLVGGFLVFQVAFFLVVVFFVKAANDVGPAEAEAAEVAAPAEPEWVEISVTPNDATEKIRAINAKKGRLVFWGLKVFLQVRKADLDQAKEKLIANENFVKQEVARIVADCEPFLLEQEADHATLKRQIRFALNGVLGKGTINEVLISECIPQNLD